MTPELTVLALAAILQSLQLAVAAAAMNADIGMKWNASSRDESLPALSPVTGRLRRAFNNHFEALILFTIAVVVVALSNQQTTLTAACSWTYLVARIFYIPAYAFDWTPWRSVIWWFGFMATLIMIISSLL